MTITDWLATPLATAPVLAVTGPDRHTAIDHLSRTVDVIHARPDALSRGLTGTYGYGAVVVDALRLDAAATTGLLSLIHRPVIRILLAGERAPALTGPDAQAVASRLQSAHLDGVGGGDPLPRVAIRVSRNRAVRARDLRALRALLTPEMLPPDAVIRGIEIRSDAAYVEAELPVQLALFGNAQGPPPIETGLRALTGNSRQEETENTDIIAHGAAS